MLLLGEIDLSVGYNAALGAVITLWMLSSNLPLWLAVVTGLAFSAAFAGLEGVIITRLRLPSFVVTLAGYLGGFGLLLAIIDMAAPGAGGTIRLNNTVTTGHRGRQHEPRRQLDRHDRGRGAHRRVHGDARCPAAGQQPRRAARQRHLLEDRADGGGRRDRRADLQPEPRRRVHGRGGRALGRAGGAGPARRLDHPAEPDPARPLHLRDRRERRGGAPGGHQPEPDPRHGVRAVRPDRRDHRHHLRLEPGVDVQQLQRRPVRAVRGGRGGDRRHQPVRRPRPDAGRGARRAGRRGDLQRPDAARPGRGGAVHLDRRWCCSRPWWWTPWPAGAARLPELSAAVSLAGASLASGDGPRAGTPLRWVVPEARQQMP